MSLKSSLKAVVTLGQGVAVGIPPAAESEDPIELFGTWFQAAQDAGILLPEAVTLATASPDGFPSARMVLLKHADAKGFVFFTNYGSQKARELEANPRAALCFHWAILQRQVRVSGSVERVDRDESSAYFATRGRGSQVGAWASKQSQDLPARAELEERVRETEAEFAGREVSLPPFWGGYRLAPTRIEFWQGRADRLHDRLVFTRVGGGWTVKRLYP
ncbi:MAG: pyridoxamine 5'-phosphate oxidase [Gemmatimonadetes bacterium]|nr:pyridoxamine 5'-phosphate oxidase [Gemmatimonadota bacterium]